MDDHELVDELTSLPAVPYLEGDLRSAPFEDRVVAGRMTAVILEDPGIYALLVDRETGEVVISDPDGVLHPVNSSLRQFVACARAFEHACREADTLDDDSRRRLEALGDSTLLTFAKIDPSAVTGENQLWSVRAEELGYGLT